MPATIFNGAKVKALKETLSLNGASDIISSSTDPSVVAVDAPVGSLLLNNSSGKLYKKLDAGSSTNWQEVGAGAGGKNYIAKGAFDTPSTSGWSLTHSTLDATSKLPNQASGSWTAAAGTLSITTVGAGSQLSLLPYSLSLVSSAATTAGDMLITDALTLDQEAQASVQTFSFFYKVASGGTNLTLAGTSANSLAVAIYDVTNGAWIDPAGRYNVVQVSGVAKCAGTFQVPSNCTSVRLAVYFPNASAGAATVYLDDFYLGPQVVQYGAPVTDWVSFTPTGSWTANVTYTGRYRRVGDKMDVEWMVQTSGAPTATGLTLNLPSGFSIDTSKILDTTVGGEAFGRGSALDAGVGYYPNLLLRYNGTTSVDVLVDFQGAAGNAVYTSGTPVTQAVPFTFAAGDKVYATAQFPILGWSSTVQMSNDTDTRVVAAKAAKTAAQSIPNNSLTKVTLSSSIFDTHSGFDFVNSRYVIQVPGIYRVSALVAWGNTPAGARSLRVYKNGSVDSELYNTIASSATGIRLNGSVTVSCVAGDYLEIYAFQDSGAALNIDGTIGSAFNYFSVERLSGPSAIAASETVAMRAYNTSGFSVPNASVTTITGWTKSFDTHGAFNATTGVYTVPVSGKYRVSGMLLFNAAAFSITNPFSLIAQQGGSASTNWVLGETWPSANGTSQMSVNGSDVIQCNAGDTISISAYQSQGGARTIGGAATENHVDIQRIGN